MTLVQWLQLGWVCVLMPAVGGSCIGVSGCSVLTTGPGVVKDVSDISKTVALAALDNLEAETGNVGVDGQVNDPRYRMRLVAGPAYVMDLELSLAGVDLQGNLQASMIARIESDPEFRRQLVAILTMSDTSEAERLTAILELIRSTAGGSSE